MLIKNGTETKSKVSVWEKHRFDKAMNSQSCLHYSKRCWAYKGKWWHTNSELLTSKQFSSRNHDYESVRETVLLKHLRRHATRETMRRCNNDMTYTDITTNRQWAENFKIACIRLTYHYVSTILLYFLFQNEARVSTHSWSGGRRRPIRLGIKALEHGTYLRWLSNT